MRFQKGLSQYVLDKMEREEGNVLTDNHLDSSVSVAESQRPDSLLQSLDSESLCQQVLLYIKCSGTVNANSSMLVGGLRYTEVGHCPKVTITHLSLVSCLFVAVTAAHG